MVCFGTCVYSDRNDGRACKRPGRNEAEYSAADCDTCRRADYQGRASGTGTGRSVDWIFTDIPEHRSE